MTIKLYTKEFAGMIPSIFESKSAFLRTFGGSVQTIQGADATANFLELKTSDTDVVIQDYNTGANVAFGTGTGSTNRFGPRKEVKSIDTQVPFDTPLAIHDGIDNYTVNDISDEVIAERLALHTVAWAERADLLMATELSTKASSEITAALTSKEVTDSFNDVRKEFINSKVSKNIGWVAYVSSDVYSFLVDSELAKVDKGSSVNMDNGDVYKFKNFILSELPDTKFVGLENAYFAPDNVGVVGIGIPLARAMDSEDFGGVALQGAGKLGKFIPAKNFPAIIKATFTPAV